MSFGTKKKILRQSQLPLKFLNLPSVFETCRVYDGGVFALNHHLKRLRASAKTIGLRIPCTSEHLLSSIKSLILKTQTKNAILRITAYPHPPNAGVCFMIKSFSSIPESYRTHGVRIVISSMMSNHIKGQVHSIKANDYLSALLSMTMPVPGSQHPKAMPYERILMGSDGGLVDGTVSNLFILKGGALWTPEPSCGILRGVTRHFVLDAAKRIGIPCHETRLTRHDVYNADEVFLTNTSSEVLSVIACDSYRIGNGRPGPLAKKIYESFKSLIEGRLEK